MQCNSGKFQLGQIEFLTANREGINATLCLHAILFVGVGGFAVAYKAIVTSSDRSTSLGMFILLVYMFILPVYVYITSIFLYYYCMFILLVYVYITIVCLYY